MNTLKEEFPSQVQEVIEFSELTYTRGLVSAAGGNISIRCGDAILITGSGVSLRSLTAEDLLLCNAQGKVLMGDQKLKPSKEMKFHLNIYGARPEVSCIIHAHPCFATALSLSRKAMPLLTESAQLKLREVPLIEKASPGSVELADNVLRAVKETHPSAIAYLLEAHGILALGGTMRECFDTAELVEDSAKIAILHRLATR